MYRALSGSPQAKNMARKPCRTSERHREAGPKFPISTSDGPYPLRYSSTLTVTIWILELRGSPSTELTVPTRTTGAARVRSVTEYLIGPPAGGVRASAELLLIINSATGIAVPAATNSTFRTGGLVAFTPYLSSRPRIWGHSSRLETGQQLTVTSRLAIPQPVLTRARTPIMVLAVALRVAAEAGLCSKDSPNNR